MQIRIEGVTHDERCEQRAGLNLHLRKIELGVGDQHRHRWRVDQAHGRHLRVMLAIDPKIRIVARVGCGNAELAARAALELHVVDARYQHDTHDIQSSGRMEPSQQRCCCDMRSAGGFSDQKDAPRISPVLLAVSAQPCECRDHILGTCRPHGMRCETVVGHCDDVAIACEVLPKVLVLGLVAANEAAAVEEEQYRASGAAICVRTVHIESVAIVRTVRNVAHHEHAVAPL